MATFFMERLYRDKGAKYDKQVTNWEETADDFEELKYVPEHLEYMASLSRKLTELVVLVLKLRSLEMAAEKKLESPTEGMYDIIKQIYGGLMYHGVDDDIIALIFMHGRPDPLNTPPAQVEKLLKQIKAAFDDTLKDHKIAEEKGPDVDRLLTERRSVVETEHEAERATLKARAQLVECSSEMDKAITALRHLSRAENVYVKGVYRAFFPLAKEPKPSSEEPVTTSDSDESVTTSDEPENNEEDFIVGGSV